VQAGVALEGDAPPSLSVRFDSTTRPLSHEPAQPLMHIEPQNNLARKTKSR